MLKHLSLIVVSVFVSLLGIGQSIVCNNLDRRVYLGLHNTFSVAIGEFPCSAIEMKVSQGKIQRIGYCSYLYEPDSVGIVTITTINKKNKRTTSYLYKVVPTPPFQILLNKRKGGEVTTKDLLSSTKLTIDLPDLDIIICGVKMQIDSFSVVVFRNREILFKSNSNSAEITEEMKSIFQNLKTGDRVLFTNIFTTTSTENSFVHPLEFVIAEEVTSNSVTKSSER